MDSERGTACCGAAEKEVSLQALQALEAEATEIQNQIFLAGGGGNWNIFGTGNHFLEKDAPIFELIFFEGVVQPPTSFFFVYKNSVPSWEVTYPFPVGTFESMILLFPFGGICFLVPWRVPLQRN